MLSPYTLNSQTSSFVRNTQTGSFVTNSQTASFATTGSNSFIGTQTITGSFIVSGSGTGINFKNLQADTFTDVVAINTADGKLSTNSLTNYLLNSQTGSFVKNTETGSFVRNTQTGSMLSPYTLNSQTASFLTTGSQNTTQTISGSLTILENLNILGSSSITFISSSTLNIGTNLITVNTINPTNRYGGLAVIDSGSSPLVSASFLYDSLQDEFIFVHKGTAAGAITSSHFMLGPETYDSLGNEIYLTANRIPKGKGNEHLNDSNITDDGTVVSINSNTQITGSLNVSAGITGSFSGSVVGYVPNEATTSFVTNSQTSSFVTNSQTGSFILNSQTASFATTGSNTYTGLQIAKAGTSGFAHRTTDYVAGTTGTSLFTALGAATGNTYGIISVRTSGGLSAAADLILNSNGSGKVAIGTSKTSANATLDVFGNTVITGSLNVTTTVTATSFVGDGSGLTGVGGGISQGKVVAIATGMANLF